MAKLYTNENFPHTVAEKLRLLGHDVLTSLTAQQANRGVPDEAVLQFAVGQGRAVLTENRKDFMPLHRQSQAHPGIIVCTRNNDAEHYARCIHHKIAQAGDLSGKLIKVYQGDLPQRGSNA